MPSVIKEKTISLKIQDYCPNDGNKFSELFSFNSSTVLDINHHISDFDRDGLSDEFEKQESISQNYNVSAGKEDTNGDGYSDLVTYALGYDRNNQTRLSTCADSTQDTDRDDLFDCAENVLRTDSTNPDTDGDGIPDGLEIRFGTNPIDSHDAIGDLDQDQLSNIEELKINTPFRTTNNLEINRMAYQYSVHSKKIQNKDCFDINIKNIPILNVSNGNLIKVFALENSLVATQGDLANVNTLKVLVSRRVPDGQEIVVSNGIQNQLIEFVPPTIFAELTNLVTFLKTEELSLLVNQGGM